MNLILHPFQAAVGSLGFRRVDVLPKVIMELNPPQKQAVNTLSGPLLVLAGAGTGKTRVVTFRIANLIRHGIHPARILAVTFTNKAAAEMQERIKHLLGKRLKERPATSTFHSHCVKILRRHIRVLGYPDQFTIYDRGDQESLARQVLREIRVPNETLRPAEVLGLISGWKSRGVLPADSTRLARTDKEHLASMAYRRYQKALKSTGSVDFDDLLLCTEQLFREHPAALRDEASRFDHLLIDEYQDTNGTQYRIVKALASGHRNLCVVGDDDQSIYGWRGAEVEHILKFRDDWPEATVVRLEHNYRSTAAILEVANRLIRFNKVRHDKVLQAARHGGQRPRVLQFPDENAEARTVVDEIRRHVEGGQFQPSQFAVLFRTNEQTRAFETELRRVKLPYVLVGGMSFFDRKEVRDILAYLRLLAAPQDEVSLLRIVNTPPRGIGSKSVETMMKAAVQSGQNLWQIVQHPTCLAANSRPAVGNFAQMIEHHRQQLDNGSTLVDVASQLIDRIDYEAELNRLYSNPDEQQSRWASVQEVINALGAYEQQASEPNMLGFLDEVALGDRAFDDEKEKQLRRNAVVLMTLHSAKGLEFPHVYMVGMEEGILPHHRSLGENESGVDEERRLCYVGVTRAQDCLSLSFPRTRMKWGKPRDTIPSRFLYELTGQAENPAQIARRQQAIQQSSANRRRSFKKRS